MHIVFRQHSAPAARNHHYLAVAISAALFLLACCYALILDESLGWDADVSQWFQSLRTPALDRMMLLVTMLADLYVSVVVVAGLLLLLISRQHWWLSFYLLCTFLSTSLGVSIIKSLTQRSRPALSESALVLMSFPSGHAARAFLVFGVSALLLSWGREKRYRTWAFIIAGGLGLAVAVSRVYLGVHWVSDVIASAAIAGAMLTAFDWQLRVLDPDTRIPAALPGITFLIMYTIYYLFFVERQALIHGLTGA